MDVFVGQLLLVPYNFAPRGYALCNGALMSISQNTALFSLLGTQYGGDGRSTFALPNLQGKMAVGTGAGPGLPAIIQGQTAGETDVTLTNAQMPTHTHVQQGTAVAGDVPTPSNAVFGSLAGKGKSTPYYQTAPAAPNTATLATASLGVIGGNQSHTNMQPSLVLNWVIATTGIYPQRQ